MIALLFIIGLLFDAFFHLIVPICFAVQGKQRKTSQIWLIALAGALLGYVACLLMGVFEGATAFVNSAIFVPIGFLILYVKCRIKDTGEN